MRLGVPDFAAFAIHAEYVPCQAVILHWELIFLLSILSLLILFLLLQLPGILENKQNYNEELEVSNKFCTHLFHNQPDLYSLMQISIKVAMHLNNESPSKDGKTHSAFTLKRSKNQIKILHSIGVHNIVAAVKKTPCF